MVIVTTRNVCRDTGNELGPLNCALSTCSEIVVIMRLEGYGSFCTVKYDSSYVSQGALRGALRGVSSALGDYI